MSRDEAQAWLDEAAQASPGTLWAIETGGELVGFADLHRVDVDNRRACFAIGMLAPRFIGRGWGRESTQLVLGHAFDGLGLHRVDLRVLAFNGAAIRSYEACGFVVEGRERDSCLLDGAWHDDVMMSILEHEFRARAESGAGG